MFQVKQAFAVYILYDCFLLLVYFVPTAPFGSLVNAKIIHPQHNPIVGEQYNLTCLYNVSKGFTHDPMILWMYPNKTNFNTSSIAFDALHASNSGTYTCKVMLTSPVLKDPDTANHTYNLTIQRKSLINHHANLCKWLHFQISVSSPNVSISVPNTTLHAGSTADLTCNVTLASEIDVNVMLNVTWLQGSTSVATNTTLIPPPHTSFTSILTSSPLSAADKNFTCSAKIFPTKQFLEESPIRSASETLEIKSECTIFSCCTEHNYCNDQSWHYVDPTINVTITPSSKQIPNVGDVFNITCTALGLEGVDPKYAYRWIRDSGEPIFQNGSTISFSSLELSNAGKYTCEVTVLSDNFVGGNVTGMSSHILSIQSKQMNCC